MKVKSINLINIKCFEKLKIELSEKINVFIGANNSGKSTILKSLLEMQYPNSLRFEDVRKGYNGATIDIRFSGNIGLYFSSNPIYYQKSFNQKNKSTEPVFIANGNVVVSKQINAMEPDNFIYPHLSNRKTSLYNEQINLAYSNTVSGKLDNLYPKIDRISNPEFMPAHQLYKDSCNDILGFMLSAIPSANGKKGGYIIKNQIEIPIDAMGEGVYNLVGLIADIAVAENKLFLIEEPENDLHPQALKKLLDLIIQKSESNQFVITTHSNIVVKHLGKIDSTNIFKVSQKFIEKIPTSACELVKEPEKRREVLEELGYEIFDYDMWECWIFFEESSAERIVRDFIIPEFFPNLLHKVRTYSARTTYEIEKKFEHFNDLFVFLHLTPVYKNKAWVILDNGENEKSIIDKMKNIYTKSGWDENCFIQFSEHDFESYYPECFQAKVKSIKETTEKQEKRKLKNNLLIEVLKWIDEDRLRAKKKFEVSAKDVIKVIGDISKFFI